MTHADGRPPRRLALFDLDLTLIPFDSGLAWLQFLVDHGALEADLVPRYLDACRQYLAGALEVRALHRLAMIPLARHSRDQLETWREQFAAAVATEIPPAAHALVAAHRDAGDLCAIVTATNRFVAEAFARAFDVPQLLASEPALDGGRFSGEIDGEMCHGAGKVRRVAAWLAEQGLADEAFGRALFYSDSTSDLPLLERVGRAVVVRPDATLRAHARVCGWVVLDELEDALPLVEDER